MENQNETVFNSIPKTEYTEAAAEVDSSAFRRIIDSRRSVRVFSEDAVPESIMQDCFDIALLAPNSSNLQPWEFYWVRSNEKKKALVQACFSQPAAKTAQELVVCVARIDTWKKHRNQMLDLLKAQGDSVPKAAFQYYQKLVPLAYELGPMGILGPIKRLLFWLKGLQGPMVREPVSRADLRLWATKSTALACENLMLAARAHGYDSCPMEGMDSKRVKKLLNLPNSASVVMVLGIGKRADNGVYGPQVRFARSQFIKEV